MPRKQKTDKSSDIQNSELIMEKKKNLISFVILGTMIMMALGFLLLTYIDYRKTLGSIDDSTGLSESMNASIEENDEEKSAEVMEELQVKAEEKTKDKNEEKTGTSTEEKSEAKSEVKTEAKTEDKPEEKKIVLKEAYKGFGSFAGYVTVGTSKDDVVKILGKPTKKTDSTYEYGHSVVIFDTEKKVYGFIIDPTSNIKITIGKKAENPSELAVGMTMLEVRDALGTPTKLFGRTWYFAGKEIVFNDNFQVEKITDIGIKK